MPAPNCNFKVYSHHSKKKDESNLEEIGGLCGHRNMVRRDICCGSIVNVGISDELIA